MLYNHGSYLSLRCWCSCSALRYSLAFRPVRAFLHREKHMARALSACLVLPSDGSPNRGGWLKPDADAYFARARSKDFGNARESASKGPQRSDCLAKSKVRMGTIACQAFHAMPGCESEMNQYPRKISSRKRPQVMISSACKRTCALLSAKMVRCQLLMRWNVPLQVGNTSLRLSA